MATFLRKTGVGTTPPQHPHNIFNVARGIDGPKSARKMLDLSLSGMGRALGAVHPNGHGGRAYSRSSVAHWELEPKRYPLTRDTYQAYVILLNQWLNPASAGRWTLKPTRRAWKFQLMARCVCGREFKPKHSRHIYCRPACRSGIDLPKAKG